jgi:nitrogen fixation NifU-like protein
MNSSLVQLYQGIILRHSKNPTHYHALDGATHSAWGKNRICGDELHVQVILDENGSISDISFEGEGCAICKASASIMMEKAVGKSEADIRAIITETLTQVLDKEAPELSADVYGDIAALQGIRAFPARKTCVRLAWDTLIAALEGKSEYIVSR